MHYLKCNISDFGHIYVHKLEMEVLGTPPKKKKALEMEVFGLVYEQALYMLFM